VQGSIKVAEGCAVFIETWEYENAYKIFVGRSEDEVTIRRSSGTV
jgi:hypothetical protein